LARRSFARWSRKPPDRYIQPYNSTYGRLLSGYARAYKAHRAASEALLVGKLYDDRGNRMSPDFSTKNRVRSCHRMDCFASVVGVKPISQYKLATALL
jgi:hypothetical protein